MNAKKVFFFLTVLVLNFPPEGTFAQKPYSIQMAESFMTWHKDSIAVKEGKPAGWDYEQGLMLKSLEKVWYRTGDAKYFEYIRKDLDRYIQKDGSIKIPKVLQKYTGFSRIVRDPASGGGK